MSSKQRRVVITGIGLISPLGSTKESLWDALHQARSGVGPLTVLPSGAVPVHVAAEAKQFTGEIDDFGPLEKEQKKQIRKALRVMCRECQMGVAVAQLALTDAAAQIGTIDPDRIGISYGIDYMLSPPEELTEGVQQCLNGDGKFEFPRWGLEGMPKMSPLWLLKYLPNMPASHAAIFNDLRGPSNSLTLREAGANQAVGEAYQIIRRGNADAMVCGATGTRLHTMKIVHTVMQEEVAGGNGDPTKVSRPFDKNRSGMVLGEGAGAIVIEELAHAQARGATIYGEIVAAASSAAAAPRLVARRKVAMANVLRALLQDSGFKPQEIDHLHAHGLSTQSCDVEEAQAIADAFGDWARTLPVVAAKSYFGNLGAGSGMIELIASLLALRAGSLFPTLNYETPDAECPLHVVSNDSTPAGKRFINLNVTPQGQASGLMVQLAGQ
ncbi:MAG: beta-ketoacyl-[acyl-carrier-protein] synthase family protein [Planctomycetota bacterium]